VLDRLDEAKRDVFVLYEIEGLTMREVCEILDCPLQTAYSRLHAARKVLTDAVDSDDRGESS
jgi:RNA polymerase sigma-70 factor (ECF subfamily)